VEGVDGDNHRSGLLGLLRISARVKVPGCENRGPFVVENCLHTIWDEFLLILREEPERETVNRELHGCGREDKGAGGVVSNRERLVESSGAGIEEWGV